MNSDSIKLFIIGGSNKKENDNLVKEQISDISNLFANYECDIKTLFMDHGECDKNEIKSFTSNFQFLEGKDNVIFYFIGYIFMVADGIFLERDSDINSLKHINIFELDTELLNLQIYTTLKSRLNVVSSCIVFLNNTEPEKITEISLRNIFTRQDTLIINQRNILKADIDTMFYTNAHIDHKKTASHLYGTITLSTIKDYFIDNIKPSPSVDINPVHLFYRELSQLLNDCLHESRTPKKTIDMMGKIRAAFDEYDNIPYSYPYKLWYATSIVVNNNNFDQLVKTIDNLETNMIGIINNSELHKFLQNYNVLVNILKKDEKIETFLLLTRYHVLKNIILLKSIIEAKADYIITKQFNSYIKDLNIFLTTYSMNNPSATYKKLSHDILEDNPDMLLHFAQSLIDYVSKGNIDFSDRYLVDNIHAIVEFIYPEHESDDTKNGYKRELRLLRLISDNTNKQVHIRNDVWLRGATLTNIAIGICFILGRQEFIPLLVEELLIIGIQGCDIPQEQPDQLPRRRQAWTIRARSFEDRRCFSPGGRWFGAALLDPAGDLFPDTGIAMLLDCAP